MALPKILIVSATGKQGGAIIESLLAQSAQFEILALTSNPSSARAKNLSSQSNVTILTGKTNISTFSSIFQTHKPIHGVLCVTTPHGHGTEEEQAKPLIDESIKNLVNHFIFCSVDRGGAKSDRNPTNIPHFVSKYNIELYLKEKINLSKSSMQYTILRPTAFMENLTSDFMGKAFASMWLSLGEKPLQLISIRDIGIFGARAFMNLDAFKGREISLAGDELTFEEAKSLFKDTLGYEMPETYGFVGSFVQWTIGEVGTMFQWFRDEGYKVDIPVLRKEHPELLVFRLWLKEVSSFKSDG